MKVFFKELRLTTSKRTELVDVTSEVELAIAESKVVNGLCLIHAPHATAAIVANENEAGLLKDMLSKLQQDYPRGAGWEHDRVDDNADAHLASAFIGSSRVFPVKDGRLVRGAWQNVFFVELDGPRGRRVIVEVLGE
ncbi:MAG: secondary thiamine-phosphate synthase enzyme YjbQ [Candidatus Nezhaarchaeota archaeon]|nr:secondary thiamine-phosphate synthase enzyme YjbQ [Candidatus Nezhaarchaeota archaeon]